MFYLLFTYSKGQREKDFLRFRSEDDVIEFLHKNYERIDIVQIISANKSFRLGLIETESLIKSELIEEDADPVPFPDSEKESEFLRSRRHASLKNKKEEPSAMSKIADDIEKEMTEDDIPRPTESEILKQNKEAVADIEFEKELTDEEIIKKNKEALQRGDAAIAAAKKDLAKGNTKLIINPAEKPAKKSHSKRSYDKSNWPICPDCNKEKMAPWNNSGRCSECQQYKKIPKKKTRKLPF